VQRLLDVLHRLVEAGNTSGDRAHLDVIRAADWIMDLGPEVASRADTLWLRHAEEVRRWRKSHGESAEGALSRVKGGLSTDFADYTDFKRLLAKLK